MDTVLFLKSQFQILDELERDRCRCRAPEIALAVRSKLLVDQTANIPRHALGTRRIVRLRSPPLRRPWPRRRPSAKDLDPRPVRKRQGTHLRNRFRAPPDHGAVHRLAMASWRSGAQMIKGRHEDTLRQRATSSISQLSIGRANRSTRPLGHAQDTHSPEQGAGQRQDGLDLEYYPPANGRLLQRKLSAAGASIVRHAPFSAFGP